MRNRTLFLLSAFIGPLLVAGSLLGEPSDVRGGAFRSAPRNGWIFVRLKGEPAQIGYTHGYLLASQIEDTVKSFRLEMEHDGARTWSFFRETAEKVLWPSVEQEYREELEGIARGVAAREVKLDLWDIVALNASTELPYYVSWLDKQAPKKSTRVTVPERCSAFVATGSYTADGKIVIGHNIWSSYLTAQHWKIAFDIQPSRGHRILMDGLPGVIHSADDFGMNSAGMVITETTISQFSGWDPKGIPEFVRARKAMQYASSIDQFAEIMKTGNNGGYANNWLVADTKTNEIASLELGLRNVNLRRTADGYFCGANFPVDEKLIREETDFDVNNLSSSSNARRIRWEQLMAENKGKITAESAKGFLADHFDTYTKLEEPSERTLCGHIEVSSRGMGSWMPPFAPAGAGQSKVADSKMVAELAFEAAAGHPCGTSFVASEHLAKHPEFRWQEGQLRDMPALPWTKISLKASRGDHASGRSAGRR